MARQRTPYDDGNGEGDQCDRCGYFLDGVRNCPYCGEPKCPVCGCLCGDEELTDDFNGFDVDREMGEEWP